LFSMVERGREVSTNEVVAKLLDEKVQVIKLFMQVYVKYGQAKTAEQIADLLNIQRDKNGRKKVSTEGQGV